MIKTFGEIEILPREFIAIRHVEATNFGINEVFDVSYPGKSGSLAQDGVLVLRGSEVIDSIGWNKNKLVEKSSKHNESYSQPLQRCAYGRSIQLDIGAIEYSDFKIGSLTECRAMDAEEESEEPAVVASCKHLKINEIGANLADDEQFIELEFAGPEASDLSGCRLKTRLSQSKFYELTDLKLGPGERHVVYLKSSNLRLTKASGGSVSISDNLDNQHDIVKYTPLARGTSFSLVNGEWVQTFNVTPGGINRHQKWSACAPGYERDEIGGRCVKLAAPTQIEDCPAGQYRHPETNRCRKIPAQVASVKPCAPGEYRHPETGRCRKLASLASARNVTPCKAGYERNPITNRCRKIATANSAKSLKPCPAGQERNPVTNRCRKVIATANSPTGFAPENINHTNDTNLLWWGLGLLGLGAVAYAGWEWRRELAGLATALKDKLPGGK